MGHSIIITSNIDFDNIQVKKKDGKVLQAVLKPAADEKNKPKTSAAATEYLRKEVERLLKENNRLVEHNTALENKILKDAPKIVFADLVKKNDTLCRVADAADLLQANKVPIGPIQLYSWLRGKNIITLGRCEFTQEAIHKGYGYNVYCGMYKNKKLNKFMISKTACLTYTGLWYIFRSFNLTKQKLDYATLILKDKNNDSCTPESSIIQTRAESDFNTDGSYDLPAHGQPQSENTSTI